MSLDSIIFLLLVSLLIVLLAPAALADEPPDISVPASEPETKETQTEATEATGSSDEAATKPTETAPAPTVAPFDFVLLEESSVQTVEQLDQVIQILTGMLFFLGVCAGMVFFKVLADRVRSV